jgi:hypothetical protein
MKKLITSVGLVALGAASLQAAYAPNMSSTETAKPWAVSATLRGFYDDNYNTASKWGIDPAGNRVRLKQGSYGFEVSPSVSVNLPLEQTFIGASYAYSLRWYEARDNNSADHSHQFNAKLDHAFSERFKIEASESFVIAQEPEILDGTGIATRPIRTEGNNIRNRASLDFHAQVSRLLGFRVGYANSFYDYEQTGVNSLSALLDRMEHTATLDSRWQVAPQTVGILGYQFTMVDQTSNDLLLGGFNPDIRNRRLHTVYVGADHNFNSQLNGSARVGAQIVEHYNVDTTDVGPFADANLTYTYLPGSYLQAGVRHAHNQTDAFSFSGANDVTTSQQSTAVYANVSHKITSKLSVSLLGQFQHSTFEGGSLDAQAEDFYIVGANLSYRINQHLLAETGYNYDNLDSDVAFRSYVRNRVYIGIRATY